MFFAFNQGFMLLACLFFKLWESYFSVPFNPKRALPPWVSGGGDSEAPGPGEPLGHCQVPGASGQVPQECWASSWLASPLHPASMGQL